MTHDLQITLALTAAAVLTLILIEHAANRRARRVILLDLLQHRATWAIDLRARVGLGVRFTSAIEDLRREGLILRSEHVQTLLACGRARRRYRYDLTPDGLNVALDLRLDATR